MRAGSRSPPCRGDNCGVGIGVVVPHLRPAIAQLAFLHVSEAFRAAAIGSHLCDDLELIAREAGDSEIVVSATPSENTVRFYLGRGYKLMSEPLPELFELEPEDVHMRKTLLSDTFSPAQ
jgi:ribosomal protein S18 acetylase RimI-like enzyme